MPETEIIITPGAPGETLLDALRGAGAAVHAPCGGNGTCRQCRVRVTGPLLAADGTVREYREEDVLACRVRPAGAVRVTLPEAGADRVRLDALTLPGGGEGLGLAADIGTTTVAVYLYDLATGRCIARCGERNAQCAYGADVISRIRFAETPGGLETLTRAVRDQLGAMLRALCPDLSRLRRAALAGNTVMEHLFAGLSPAGIGRAPFAPLSLFGFERAAAEFLPGLPADCMLYLCPAVSGYVGGDITAGLLASGAARSAETVLFLDVGTNGEMALGDRDGFLCCAAAAGPAFEGAEIACGSRAVPGAIFAVDRDLTVHVIGGCSAETLCGSGLIDAAAALLENGLLDETGRLRGERYDLTDRVFVTAQDLRQLQLAKAAVRAGIETLLARSGKRYTDVSAVLLAGGFGASMDLRSACAIGLLPPALREKTRHVGNSAGLGAALCLTDCGREGVRRAAARCRYLELSGARDFDERFVDAMFFDEWEDLDG